MREFFFTPDAERDLEHLWQYIARDSIHYADKVETAIFKTCRLAATMPNLGRKRPELSKRNVHFLSVSSYENYLIAFVPGTDPLRVIGVLHGARDFKRLFKL